MGVQRMLVMVWPTWVTVAMAITAIRDARSAYSSRSCASVWCTKRAMNACRLMAVSRLGGASQPRDGETAARIERLPSSVRLGDVRERLRDGVEDLVDAAAG